MVLSTEFQFPSTKEKGEVSALYSSTPEPRAIFVLAHGAGANMQHVHMERLTEVLVGQNISVLRFNFPFMQAGGKRVDSQPVCLETIGNAIKFAHSLDAKLPLILAGHSFGGRMNSHFAAKKNPLLAGLVYFSFPLHPSKKPDIKRAEHLPLIDQPQLFVSGTRDSLADLELLEPVVAQLKHASLHLLETADHSYKILKRTRTSQVDVYDETAEVVTAWLKSIANKNQIKILDE